MFRRCPGLSPYAHMCTEILARFAAFKQGVPVMGAVLLDPTMKKCLLVRGFAAHSAWGFPRGKLAKGESDHVCAIREVGHQLHLPVVHRLRVDRAEVVHMDCKPDCPE